MPLEYAIRVSQLCRIPERFDTGRVSRREGSDSRLAAWWQANAGMLRALQSQWMRSRYTRVVQSSHDGSGQGEELCKYVHGGMLAPEARSPCRPRLRSNSLSSTSLTRRSGETSNPDHERRLVTSRMSTRFQAMRSNMFVTTLNSPSRSI